MSADLVAAALTGRVKVDTPVPVLLRSRHLRLTWSGKGRGLATARGAMVLRS